MIEQIGLSTVRRNIPLLLLCLGAFLAPILGGYINVRPMPLDSGLRGMLDSLSSVQGAVFAHALIALLVFSAVAILLIRRQVLQLPQPAIAITLAALVAFFVLSIGLSNYKILSFTTGAEWLICFVAFMAVIACGGRWRGLKLLCAFFVAGCFLVAMGGVDQYVGQPDPTWRIMVRWQDPNAMAGMLLLGLFAGIGLSYSSSRLAALLPLIASGAIGSAIILTQSKGALVSVLLGFLALFVMIGVYSRERAASRLGSMLLVVVIAVAGTAWFQHIQRSPRVAETTTQSRPSLQPPQSPQSLGRLLNPASTAEQSAGFRLNLWKGCLHLIKERPTGYGAGTYRFESAMPGNTTETQLAHNTFLQLAVEIGPLGAMTLVVLLVLCAYHMLRGTARLPEPQNMFRCAVFVALLTSVAHSAFDSDWYFFGNGLGFFLLLAVGLNLSADAVVPEILPKTLRFVGIAVAAFCTVFLFFSGELDLKLSWFLAARNAGAEDARAQAASLQAFCPMDYRVWYYTANLASSRQEARQFAQNSVDNGPNLPAYRLLAGIEASQGRLGEAQATLKNGLSLDPNNLPTLMLLLRLMNQTDPAQARQLAQRIVDIEKLPYFAIRSIPELVPTETYQARVYLAQKLSDPRQKSAMLRPAIEGLLDYAATTVPKIEQFAAEGLSEYGDPADARAIIREATVATRQLRQSYAQMKDSKDVAWTNQALDLLSKADNDLSRSEKPAA